MKVAIYARISIDPEKQKPNSTRHIQDVENQLIALRQFCKSSSYDIYNEYIDKVTGSGSKDRPSFKLLFRDAHQRKFDLVLFWALDRFSREGTLTTLKYLEQLESYKIAWKSYTEPHLDSMGIFRDVIISLMATLAKQERIRISERTKEGIASRRAKGFAIGRPEKKIDRKEFAKCFNEGFSNAALARRFDIADGTAKKITLEMIASKEMEPTQSPNRITIRDLRKK